MGNFVYKCRECGTVVESDIREQVIWPCPTCAENEELPYEDRLRPLYRKYTVPHINSVWHEHFNYTTGQVVSDRKQFTEQLHIGSERVSERLGLKHDFQPADLSDKKTLGVTEEGLDATHDKFVELGWKESKGRFVYPLSDKPNPSAVSSPSPAPPSRSSDHDIGK